MVRPIWLIEADVYGTEVEPLAAEIRRQGMPCEFVRYRELVKGPLPLIDGQPIPSDACAVVYGTYPAVRHVQLHTDWVPGGWCNPANLDCACYYAHFGPHLLNRRYAMMPGVEALRLKDWLFDAIGTNDEMFARPTGVHKLFVGRRISRNQFETALAPTRYDPATMVLIAEPREIGREWRLVVSGSEVIAGSQYAVGGARAVLPDCPAEVAAFVRSVLDAVRWRPDDLFMLDVCESDGALHVVELNSFSCSWLYACDVARVVATTSEQAARAWDAAESADASAKRR
jgi:hypothetical protein